MRFKKKEKMPFLLRSFKVPGIGHRKIIDALYRFFCISGYLGRASRRFNLREADITYAHVREEGRSIRQRKNYLKNY